MPPNPPLCTLPPELLEMMFCQVGDVRSTLSLAATCRYVRAAFLTARRQILLAAHIRMMEDHGLGSCIDASVLAMKARDLVLHDNAVFRRVYNLDRDLWWDSPERQRARVKEASKDVVEKVDAFLTDWEVAQVELPATSNQVCGFNHTSPTAKIRALRVDQAEDLCKLYQMISFLVSEYKQEVTSHNPATGEYQSSDNPSLTKTSCDLENLRLFQAFYRWELWSVLVSGPANASAGGVSGHNHPGIPSEQQIALLFRHAEEWEIETLACIADHARSCWKRVFEEIASSRKEIELSDPDSEFVVRTRCESPDLLSKSEDNDIDYYLDTLTSWGPRVLYDILLPRREETSQKKFEHITELLLLPCESLSDALVTRPPPDALEPRKDSTPPGWLWSSEEEVHIYNEIPVAGDLRKKSLRNWGYVFWSKERLSAWGFISASIADSELEEDGIYRGTLIWSCLDWCICWRENDKPVR